MTRRVIAVAAVLWYTVFTCLLEWRYLEEEKSSKDSQFSFLQRCICLQNVSPGLRAFIPNKTSRNFSCLYQKVQVMEKWFLSMFFHMLWYPSAVMWSCLTSLTPTLLCKSYRRKKKKKIQHMEHNSGLPAFKVAPGLSVLLSSRSR